MPETQHIVGTWFGIGAGVNTINKFHVMEDTPTVQDRQALAIALRDNLCNRVKTGCSSSMSWIAITISRVNDPNDSPFMLPINQVGGGSGLLPMQVAIQYNLFSGEGGRSGRGRFFVGGIAPATNSGGQITSAVKLSLDAEINTMIGQWALGGSQFWHLGISSRKQTHLRIMRTMSYNSIFSTLRSRKIGIGI